MAKIQLTVEVPDDLDTIDHLELYVNQLGQQVKREILMSLVAERIDREKQTDLDSSACPHCKKKESVSIGSRPRTLKTMFGEVHFTVPRQKCQNCQQTWSLTCSPLANLQPLFGSNITTELRRIAILCGASWPFRQAASVLEELTGVKLSFSHIRWLCANEGLTAEAQANEKYNQAEWEALVETMEVLVEYLADEPNEQAMDLMSRAVELNPGTQRIYTGIDGTFINAIDAKRFIEAKAAIVFTDERIQVSKGRNLLLNKQYVGSCQPVKEFGEKLFCCVKHFGVNDQTELGETSLQPFYLYLRNNFDSIVDYHTYRRNGYFISSVFVEKTIDLLICRRLKLRGQNWSREGAENIVTFRQMIQNEHWEEYWQHQKAA